MLPRTLRANQMLGEREGVWSGNGVGESTRQRYGCDERDASSLGQDHKTFLVARKSVTFHLLAFNRREERRFDR